MANIYDVAERAGVSIATVSRALNRSRRVSPDVCDRVLRAAEELGYRPNRMAQSLAGRPTHAIGLILPWSIENPFYSLATEAVGRRARELGYELVCTLTHGHDAEGYIETVLAMEDRRVEGLIVCSNARVARLIREARKDEGLPTVYMGCLPEDDLTVVTVDEYGGAFRATQHLQSLGHEHIVFAGLSHEEPRPLGRESGYLAAMGEAGLESLILSGDTSPSAGRSYATRICTDCPEATAVIAFSDILAWGMLAAFAEQGLCVPADISVVGFDDLVLSRACTPPLTTVVVPTEAMGCSAVDLLLRLREAHEGPSASDRVVLTPDIVLRSSTTVPRLRGASPSAAVTSVVTTAPEPCLRADGTE